MEIPFYQVDAFASALFTGNPAAVCPLRAWLPDATMQSIAMENHLAETAFLVKRGEGDYQLRWFTPAVEVDLCGHATLASAWVVFEKLEPGRTSVSFETRSGTLRVARKLDLLALDFPARPPEPVRATPPLLEALGGAPAEVWAARDYLVVYASAAEILALAPDMRLLKQIDRFAAIVTAPGDGDCDFVSRFFAPAQGVDEDPVTGSAHTTLIPYWAARLNKTRMLARQLSARRGELHCEMLGERVSIAGRAVLYASGLIHLPA
jgi:predicted PhzF superfamily epimerase YddE/YHI9